MLDRNVFRDDDIIIKALERSVKTSRFKEMSQQSEVDKFRYADTILNNVKNHIYRAHMGVKFVMSERGKIRYITSSSVIDKAMNHIINDYVIVPCISRFLVYDNGASQKDKGVAFHRKRFRVHLEKFFRRRGSNEGFILFVDFSSFYANILHSRCIELLDSFLARGVRDNIISPEERRMTHKILKSVFRTFEIDVSRFSSNAIGKMVNGKVDPMINSRIPYDRLTKNVFLKKGVDIGNQSSQSIGIVFPHEIDNFVKIVCGIKEYGRYTDDIYVIHEDKKFLQEVLGGIKRIAQKWGIIVNTRKTRIVKLDSFYTHLQDKYRLCEDGVVDRRIRPKGITRERRKVRKYKNLIAHKKMTREEAVDATKSWIASNYKRMSHLQVKNFILLYHEVFGGFPKFKKTTGKLCYLIKKVMNEFFQEKAREKRTKKK